MQDMQLAIQLLTIVVILLSLVIIVVLLVLTIVLLKLRKVVKQVNQVTDTAAMTLAYLQPVTWVRIIKSLIHRRK